MITAGDFRKGITVEIDGSVFVIVDFLHVKPGKGAAFVRTKLKNVMTGAVLERTFNPSDKYPLAHIERKEMRIYTRTAGYTILWTTRPTTSFPLIRKRWRARCPL